jgi:hypothetical protein
MMIAAITNLPARRFSGLLSFGSVLRKIGSSGAFGVMKYLSLNTPITNAANALEFQKETVVEILARQLHHLSWCETFIANTAAISVHGRGGSRFLAARAGDGFGTRCASAVRWQDFDLAFRQGIGFGLFHDDAPFCDNAQMGSFKMSARP